MKTKPTKQLEIHPLANIFPMMSPEELDELADDIRENGCHTPVIIYEGKILDGRNRVEACRIAGGEKYDVEPFKGKDPLAFVLSLNLRRRHLTTAQRAMVAANIANLSEGRPKNENSANLPSFQMSQEQAAEQLHVSTRSVTTAKKIIERATPAVKKAVQTGKKTLNEAAASIKKKPSKDQVGFDEDEIDDSLKAALLKIGENLGAPFVKALKNGTLPMKRPDILHLGTLDEKGMKELEPFIVDLRWDIKKALKFINKMVDSKTTVGDLQNHALANGGKWNGTVNRYEITVVYHPLKK